MWASELGSVTVKEGSRMVLEAHQWCLSIYFPSTFPRSQSNQVFVQQATKEGECTKVMSLYFCAEDLDTGLLWNDCLLEVLALLKF